MISDSFLTKESKHSTINRITTHEYNIVGYDRWNVEEINVTTEDNVYILSKMDVEKYNIKPVFHKTTYSYYFNNNNPSRLRDRGHGIAFQSTLNCNGLYGS